MMPENGGNAVGKARAMGDALVRTLLACVLAVGVCLPFPGAYADEPAGSGGVDEVESSIDAAADDAGGSPSGDDRGEGAADDAAPDDAVPDDAVPEQDGKDAAPRKDASGDSGSEAQPADEVRDLGALWASDDPVIDSGGLYELDGDVKASEPLAVRLDEGQEATVDLAGFSVVVGGEATCAVDLSGNKGTVTFKNTAYDPAETDDGRPVKPDAGITLKPSEFSGDLCAVNAVRSADTREVGDAASATFDGVSLGVEAAAKAAGAYASGVCAVRTGADFDGGDDGKAVSRVALRNCAVEVRVDRSAAAEEARTAGGEPAPSGAAHAVRAECGGVEIGGRFFCDVTGGADDVQLSSRRAGAFELAADVELAEAVTFGFPDGEDAGEVVVARSAGDAPFSAAAREKMRAAEGFEVKWDDAGGELSLRPAAESAAEPDGQDGGQAGDAGEQAVPEAADGPAAGEAGDGAQPAGEPEGPADEPVVASARSVLVQALGQVHAMAAGGEVDLASAWSASSSGLATLYTITVGGTYRLGKDIEATNGLVVNAPGQDVVIRFDGHTLKAVGAGGADEKAVVRISAAKSVSFVGASASGTSKLVAAGSSDLWLVSAEAVGCAVAMSDLELDLAPSSNSQVNLGAHCVRANDGSMSLERCTLNMDFGTQRLTSTSQAKAAEAASAVYASSWITSLSVVDCTVESAGTPTFALDDTSDIDSLGNVYGLYSLAESATVSGGSFKAISVRGSATCIYGKTLKVGGAQVTLSASAGQIASGLLSNSLEGVEIDAPLDFTFDSSAQSAGSVAACLRSTQPNAFVLGPVAGLTAGSCSAYVTSSSPADANAEGTVIGLFSDNLAYDRQQAWAAAIVNALGSDAACSPTLLTSYGVYFKLVADNAHAAARIDRASGTTYYSTVDKALSKLADGDVLTLLRDAGDLEVTSGATAMIDLNGKTVDSLTYSASDAGAGSGTGLTVRNGRVCGTVLLTEGRVAVHHAAALPLTLDSVKVGVSVTDNNVMGVHADADAAGSLTLRNCAVDVVGVRSAVSFTVYGVRSEQPDTSSLSLSGTTVSASTSSAGVGVVGVAGSNVSVSGGAVSATGSSSTTTGVQASGDVSVSGGAAVSAHVKNSATAAYGILERNAGASCTVDSSTVSVTSDRDAEGADYWCVHGAGAGDGTAGTALTLKGACSFTSASGKHIGDGVPGITLQGFSLASGGKLTVSQASVADNIGFTSAAGSDISALAGVVEPVPGSSYDGWKVVAPSSADKNLLKWIPAAASSAAVVNLVRGGATVWTYADVSKAVAAAAAGDTVRLTCDIAEPAALVVDKDLTLDLAGHALTIRAGKAAGSSSSPAAAVSVTGAASFAVVSQGGAGTLALEVGAPSEMNSTEVYQGISVSGGGSLNLASQVAASVSYTGSSELATQRQLTLRGIAVDDGSLDLQGSLRVVSTTRDDHVGALDAYGIYASAPDGAAAHVVLGGGGSVEVVNDTGSIVTDSSNYGSSNADDGPPSFLRWYLDEDADPELYEAVQSQFKVMATYDNPDDFNSNSQYGTGIYYTSSALTLDAPGKWYDGMKVWAFSDVIAPKNVGKLDFIVAKYFFLQVPVETPAHAFGIATAGTGSADVTVSGTVRATCASGDAVALEAGGGTGASWKVDGSASLAASASMEVRATRSGNFDLRDVIDFGKDYDSAVTYRGRSRTVGYAAQFESPSARGISAGDGVSFVRNGTPAVTVSGLAAAESDGLEDASAGDGSPVVFKVGDAVVASFDGSAPIDLAALSALATRPKDAARMFVHSGWTTSRDEFAVPELGTTGTASPGAGSVYYATFNGVASSDCSVSFVNMFDSAGSPADDVTVSAAYGQTVGEALADASVPVPAPGSYTVGDVTYRFVGWHDFSTQSATATSILNPGDLTDFVIDASSNAGNSCDVVFWATYVPVASDERLITFEVDDERSFCAVKVGERPYYRLANSSSSTSEAPSKVTKVTGERYEFSKWVDVTSGSPGESYPLVLPLVTGDAVYQAAFDVDPSDVTLTFYVMKSNGSGGYVKTTTVVQTTYDDAKIQAAADGVIKTGDKVSFGGLVYTFLGWSLRSSDVEPVYYTPDNPLTAGNWASTIMSSQSYSATYYGVYKSNAHMVNVSFIDGGTVIGDAEIDATATIDEAFAFTGAKAPADKSAKLMFLGWNTKSGMTTNLNGSLVTIEGLAGASAEKLDLFSVYGPPPTYSVTLHDEKNTKRLYQVYVLRGSTVQAAAKAKKVTISAPAKTGSYFNGWRSASGKLFSLTTPVTGPADLFASYGSVTVESDDTTDADATVTCTASGLEDAQSVVFTLHKRRSADSVIAHAAANAGYSILKSYDISLDVTSSAGKKSSLKGDIGLATIKIYVGREYADAKIRVFWIGGDGTASHSAEKKVDSKGYITVGVGDYGFGDADEGGNLTVAYASGSGSTGTLEGSTLSLGSDSAGLGAGGSSSLSLGAGGLSAMLNGASLNTLSISASANASLNDGATTSLGKDESVFSTSDEASEESLAADGSADGAAALDGDTVAFLLGCLAALALIVFAVWKLFLAVARRRDSDDDDIPIIPTTLARGIRF